MPILDCDRIREGVGKYNNSDTFKGDLGLRSGIAQVESLPPSLGRFIAEVCMVADWGSIPYFPFDVRIAMAAEIEICWPLLQKLRGASGENPDNQADVVSSAVDALLHTRLLKPSPTAKKQLSFISKYLHFCIKDHFPIWDTNSRIALGHTDSSSTWPSYKTWAKKVRKEAAEHEKCCLEGLKLIGENPIRTLDKALYIIGKRKVDITQSEKVGRKLLQRRPVSDKEWGKWAKAVDKWLSDTAQSLQNNFGAPAVEKFGNETGPITGSHPDVPAEFKKRMEVVNHRLQNLDAISQQPDAYLPGGAESNETTDEPAST